MIDHTCLRAVQFYIDILVASDVANSVISESMRTDAMLIAFDMISSLYDRSVLDLASYRDLMDKVSIAYAGGAQ